MTTESQLESGKPNTSGELLTPEQVVRALERAAEQEPALQTLYLELISRFCRNHNQILQGKAATEPHLHIELEFDLGEGLLYEQSSLIAWAEEFGAQLFL